MNKKEQSADTIQGRLKEYQVHRDESCFSHRIFYSLFDADHFYTV